MMSFIQKAWLILGAGLALRAQTFTLEADPDVYFDRGITVAAGIKPAEASRWTFLSDFASRKVGPLRNDERLEWRVGGTARYRILGQRSGVFGQFSLSFDQFQSGVRTSRGLSARPGVGAQWFPWRARGFYVAPLLAIENSPGRKQNSPRGEFRIGWQF